MYKHRYVYQICVVLETLNVIPNSISFLGRSQNQHIPGTANIFFDETL